MAVAACSGCGGRQSEIQRSGCHDLLMGVPGEWRILRCRLCGLRFSDPRPGESELLQYYPSNYHVYTPAAAVRTHPIGAAIRKAAMAPYRFRFGDPDLTVRPFGSGRFLDVGCGAGSLLKRMTALGWKCTGIDISPTAVQAAQASAPAAVVTQATLTTFRPDQRYALISLHHVLEHLPNPAAALQRCRELLEPGGQLIVSVPNIDSAEAKLFGSRWIGLDIPRHLTHFTPKTIVPLAARCGFELLRLRPAMFASSLAESLALCLPPNARQRLLGSKFGRLLYFTSVFPASVSYALGNAPVIELLLRKQGA